MSATPRRLVPVRRLAVACGLPLIVAAAWAFWPLPTPSVETPTIESSALVPARPTTVAPLDLAAFRAPLWVAQPPPPPPPAPAPPPPPLRLQLVAIVRDGQTYRAALYDPDQDRLLVVGAGETIAGRTVERVGPAEVTVRDSGVSRTLSLISEGGRP